MGSLRLEEQEEERETHCVYAGVYVDLIGPFADEDLCS